MPKEHAGLARVFRKDPIRFAKDAERPERHILQISDRRRDEK